MKGDSTSHSHFGVTATGGSSSDIDDGHGDGDGDSGKALRRRSVQPSPDLLHGQPSELSRRRVSLPRGRRGPEPG